MVSCYTLGTPAIKNNRVTAFSTAPSPFLADSVMELASESWSAQVNKNQASIAINDEWQCKLAGDNIL